MSRYRQKNRYAKPRKKCAASPREVATSAVVASADELEGHEFHSCPGDGDHESWASACGELLLFCCDFVGVRRRGVVALLLSATGGRGERDLASNVSTGGSYGTQNSWHDGS